MLLLLLLLLIKIRLRLRTPSFGNSLATALRGVKAFSEGAFSKKLSEETRGSIGNKGEAVNVFVVVADKSTDESS